MQNNPPPLDIPVDDAKSGLILALSSAWHQWFDWLYSIIKCVINYGQYSVVVPTNGFSLVIPDGIEIYTLNPAGTLATGSIELPVNPNDGQRIEVNSTKTVTALTVTAAAGQTIKNSPSTISAGSGFSYYYNLSSTTWFRRF